MSPSSRAAEDERDRLWICANCGQEITGKMHLITPVEGIPRAYHDECPNAPDPWQEAFRQMFRHQRLRGIADPFFNRIVRGRRG